MPSLLHEVLADIVRKHPYVAALLVEPLTGLPLGAMQASKSDPNWSELDPPEVRSDLVLELREPVQPGPSRALVLSGRGIAVPEDLRRALCERSSDELDEALRRSAIVATAEDLLEG